MGLKKNILYSGVLTASLYVFQLITYPYVSRVLGVENIGLCNYILSIVQYGVLFSSLGISVLGVREIAKSKDDLCQLTRTFSGLFTLHILFTLIVLVIYLIIINTVPQLENYKKLLYIGAIQIASTPFVAEWFFKGLEDFKYITIRSTVIRVLYVISIFLFVKEANDYIIYFSITIGMMTANAIVNWTYLTKKTKIALVSPSSIYSYFRPLIYLGAQNMLAASYTTFNVAFLGFISNPTEVGFYTTATKIEGIIIALYSSFTMVMMPRISVLLEQKNNKNVEQLIKKSFDLMFALIIPCVIIIEFFAEEIVYIIAGRGYEGAVSPLRIVAFLLLIVGISQILVVQLLMPIRADKEIFICYVVGAIVGLFSNILLVPIFLSCGSSFVWLISEFFVAILAYHYACRKFIQIHILKQIISYVIHFLPLALVLFIIKYFTIANSIYLFSIASMVVFIYAHTVLYYIVRNETYISCVRQIANKVNYKY